MCAPCCAYNKVWKMIKHSPNTLWVGVLPRATLGFSTMGIGVFSVYKFTKILENLI